MANILVVGAGVVGLSTAVCVQNALPDARVTIMADKLFDETTSHGAAGIFRPLRSKNPGVPLERLMLFLETSWNHLSKLAYSPEGGRAGVNFISGYHLFNSPIEVGKGFDLVVNCSGLGSELLADDKTMVPIRGHLLRVTAPWLKHFIYTEDDCHLIPGIDEVIVGRCTHPGRRDMLPLKEDHDGIWERAVKIYPPIQMADRNKMKDWVGLRPHRRLLRVEKGLLQCGSRMLPVVHNYGHGAEGVSLSWGTAVAAARLVVEALATKKTKHYSRL